MQPSSDRLFIWKEWVRKHAEEMAHIADFEARFVLEILSKIPEVDPDDLIPQYPFYDAQKKLRRIDFLILNPEKGFALAIELDGYSKIQCYSDWEDLFVRQNALLESLNCMLLRYANRLWLTKPKRVIAEIRETLCKQSIAHQAKQASRRSKTDGTEDLKQLIEENRKVREQVEELKRSLQRFQAQASASLENNRQETHPLPSSETRQEQQPHASSTGSLSRSKAFLYVAGLVVLAMTAFLFTGNTSETTSVATEANVIATPAAPTSTVPKQTVPFDAPDPDKPNAPARTATVTEAGSTAWSAMSTGEVATPLSGVKAISIEDAARHIGEEQTVCGRLAQVIDGDKFAFLSFGFKFTILVFAIVIPLETFSDFKGINLYVDKEVCIKGMIEAYQNKPQIRLRNSSQWVR